MADQYHLEILQRGVKYWNEWRQKIKVDQLGLPGADLSRADLSRADLSKIDLSGDDLSVADLFRANLTGAHLSRTNLTGAYLSRTNLTGVDLTGSNLTGAHLSRAYLTGANLSRADLSRAYLSEANLTEANLSGANLSGANLSGANLSGANLSGANLGDTTFANSDLSMVRGLVEIDHLGPSHVEFYTVKLPQDGSALHFLRGTGVPDEWIDFYRSTMMLPIQYYSCFISYAYQDEILAQRLHADLQDRGVRCWFAPEDMKIGDKIRVRIDEAIHVQEKLLLLLSEHSLASAWVEDEVEIAFEKEQRQQRDVLFPVRLDETVMQTNEAWATKLRRTRHIGDFTHWMNPPAYQQAFERLLRDLKVTQREESI